MSPVFKPSCFLTGAGTVSWPFDDILDSKWAILLSLHLREFPHRNEFVRRSQAPHDLPAKAVNLPLARKGDERDLPGLPRLEADRGAGRDVEAHAAGLLALERERRIGLEEMIMRADLDRPVAGVGDRKLHAGAAGVENDLATLGDDFAGDHDASQPPQRRSGAPPGSRGGRHPEVRGASAEPRRTAAHLTTRAANPEPMITAVAMDSGSRFARPERRANRHWATVSGGARSRAWFRPGT